MKKFLNTFVVFAAMTAMVSVSSCTKTCDAGYEGSDCKTEVRTKIVGNYTVAENCTSSGNATYTVAIAKSSSDVLKVTIIPFGGYPALSGTATVDGTAVTVAAQTVGAYTFNGTGTIVNGGTSITMSYTMTINGTTETCTGTWTKQ